MSLEFDANNSIDSPTTSPVVNRPVTENRSTTEPVAKEPAKPAAETSAPEKNAAETPVVQTEESFAEVALRLGGASDDEAKRTGVIDTADDQVEALFAERYKTVNSPVHLAVWNAKVPTDLFYCEMPEGSPLVETVVQKSLDIVQRHRDAGTLFNGKDKIADVVMSELGDAGYWGLLVSPEYGGSGATMREFARMITRMATIDPTVAGLASVHGCIGAVDPVRSFGTDEQKERFLPKPVSYTHLTLPTILLV